MNRLFPALALISALIFASHSEASAQAPSGERIDDYREFALANSGDKSAGERLFRENPKAVCANCHRVTGMERSGPNLDGIGDKYSRAELIDHILKPNAVIKPGFEQAVVALSDGRVMTGRMERSTKLIVRLIDAEGKQRDIKKSEIDDLKMAETSLMPTGLAEAITPNEFADLVAYLESLRFGVKQGQTTGGMPVSIPRLKRPIDLKPVHSEQMAFDNPVWCGALPGHPGDLLVAEHQQAKVWRFVRAGEGRAETKELFVDLGPETYISGNQGVMCVAFHPDYTTNRRYFLEHEVREQGEVKTTVVERRADANGLRDRGGDSIRLLEVTQPAFNHNGGCIDFGPDGKLYAAFGDGGPQKDPEGYSQNRREFLGSFLRIDVDKRDGELPYSIPTDNPFVEAHRIDASVRSETWAIGFREPWRFSFDQLTGDLWVGDVGQNKYEEVAIVRAGENHGWNVREGFASFSDEFKRDNEKYTDPLFVYEHGLGFSVTGGYVYRGDPDSSFYGVYVFGDYNTRRIWGLRQEDGVLLDVRELGTAPAGIASFGLDHDGEILMVTYDGQILHVDLSKTRFE